MQLSERAEPRPSLGVALVGDLGGRVDALLAVAMLNGFTAKGEARRIALANAMQMVAGEPPPKPGEAKRTP